MIDKKFCTWHDSCAVVACANCLSDMTLYNGIIPKPDIHRICEGTNWISVRCLDVGQQAITWANDDPCLCRPPARFLTKIGMLTRGVVCDVGLNKQLNKQPSCRWFKTPWRSCNFTVIIMIWWGNGLAPALTYRGPKTYIRIKLELKYNYLLSKKMYIFWYLDNYIRRE